MISNPDNPTIREIRKLRKRRERERRRSFIVEGHRALEVALKVEAPVERVVHTSAATVRRSLLLKRARTAGVPLVEVTPKVMAVLTSIETAPDVIGVASLPDVDLAHATTRFGLGVVLAGVRDPATAGAILASCAAAGGSAAVATQGTTDLFAQKAVRSAAGAHFVLSIAGGVSPEECAEALGAAGVRLVAVDPAGEDPAEIDLSEPVAIVVGDDPGVAEIFRNSAVALASLGGGSGGVRPSTGVEAAVVLFEAARRRQRDIRERGGRGHG